MELEKMKPKILKIYITFIRTEAFQDIGLVYLSLEEATKAKNAWDYEYGPMLDGGFFIIEREIDVYGVKDET